jgi:hypothetical protein
MKFISLMGFIFLLSIFITPPMVFTVPFLQHEMPASDGSDDPNVPVDEPPELPEIPNGEMVPGDEEPEEPTFVFGRDHADAPKVSWDHYRRLDHKLTSQRF